MPRLNVADARIIDSRDGTFNKTPFIKNGYVEKNGEVTVVTKRPGLSIYKANAAGQAGGVLSYVTPAGDEILLSFIGNTVYSLAYGPAITDAVETGSTIYLGGGSSTSASEGTIFSFGGYMWIVGGVTRTAAGGDLNTRFFAYYSTDGNTWTAATDVADNTANYPRARSYVVLVYNEKIWLLGGITKASSYNRESWSSPDGVVWTRADDDTGWTAGMSALRGCVHENRMYALIGNASWAIETGIQGVAYSTDGITWTFGTNKPWTVNPSDSANLGQMYSQNGNICITLGPIDDGVGANYKSYYSSDDGDNWTATANTAWDGSGGGGGLVQICSFQSGGFIWALIWETGGNGSATFAWYYTSDGITWTRGNQVGTSMGSSSDIYHLLGPGADLPYNCGVYNGYVYNCDRTIAYNVDKVWATQLNVLTQASVGTVPLGKYDYSQTYDLTKVMFKCATRAFQLSAVTGTLSAVTDAQYPVTTCRGLVYLNGFFYVMDTDGTIWNSEEDDPTSWLSTDFVSAEFEPDGGVALAKQGSNVVAFGSYTTELFWDAGNATGSPLSAVESGTQLVGCVNGDSVQELEGALVFIAQSKTVGQTFAAGKFVGKLDGGKIGRISQPSIDRILEADGCANVDAVVCSAGGQGFYVLSLYTTGLSLAYHIQSGSWYWWEQRTASAAVSVSSLTQVAGLATATATAHGLADGDEVTIAGATPSGYNLTVNVNKIDANTFTYPVSSALATPATGTITVTGSSGTTWPIAFGCNYGGNQILLGTSNGDLYTLDPDVYQDDSVTIDFVSRLPKYDAGNNLRKFCGRVEVVGDKSTGTGKYLVRNSDNDWVGFSYYRAFDATLPRVGGERWGNFRRRSFDIRHTANERARVEVLDVSIGS